MPEENKIDFIEYDCFADEYVLERDPYAPPERYLTIARGSSAIIEHWMVDQDGAEKALDIAYNPEDYDDIDFQKGVRNAMMAKNHCTIKELRYMTIPEKDFEEILKDKYNQGERNEN